MHLHLPSIGTTLASQRMRFHVLTCAHAITPDFRTISGFVPKLDGFQRTKSAIVPTATWPTTCEIPCVSALPSSQLGESSQRVTYGLMVYLATYLLTRPLSFLLPSPSPSSLSGPRSSLILAAVLQVRLTTSPTRPIA
jgi:hypothetical protein